MLEDDFRSDTIALIDLGADLNCIQEGLIPTKYFEITKEKLNMANGSKLKINYKLSGAKAGFQQVYFKTPFILVKNLNRHVILGTPFFQSNKAI